MIIFKSWEAWQVTDGTEVLFERLPTGASEVKKQNMIKR